MHDAAKAIEAEGWAFVEVSPSYDYEFTQDYQHIYPEPVELSQEDADRLQAIDKEFEHLRGIYHDSDNQDELDEKWDALEIEQEQIEAEMEAYTSEQKASAGVYVSYRHGEIHIIRGLVEKQAPTNDVKADLKPKKEISERLMERLTSHKTLALQDVLSKSPEIAFDLVLTKMVKETFLTNSGHSNSCFHLRMGEPHFPHDDESLKDCFAHANKQKAFEKWENIIQPNDVATLYEDISSLKKEQKMELLAFCFAGTLDAIKHPKEHISKSKQDMIYELADLLKLDMTKYWKPSASLYFNHISKDNIMNAIKEVKGAGVAGSFKKLKKSDLANAAEKQLEGSNWLPKPLQVGIHQPEPA